MFSSLYDTGNIDNCDFTRTDPQDLIIERIGASELNWDDVPTLLVFDGDLVASSPPTSQAPLPPPLPSDAPPPPPPDPPPPLPPETFERLINYRSAFYDFSTLQLFNPRYPFPIAARGPHLDWQVEPVIQQEKEEEQEEEEDMEIESESDE